MFKLWLNELSPIDGGNDYLGTNKELGCFRFEDRADGSSRVSLLGQGSQGVGERSSPAHGHDVTGPKLPRPPIGSRQSEQGQPFPRAPPPRFPLRADPTRTLASRRRRWAFAADWRQAVLQEVTPKQLGLSFGESEWAKRFQRFGFSPAVEFLFAVWRWPDRPAHRRLPVQSAWYHRLDDPPGLTTHQPDVLQQGMKARLRPQAGKHRAHPEPGEVGGPLGMGFLQQVERFGALVEADVNLGDSRRRDVALARETP